MIKIANVKIYFYVMGGQVFYSKTSEILKDCTFSLGFAQYQLSKISVLQIEGN